MRLLILTQKVDKDDPVLGFFHRWIEEFAGRCERVIVIALGVGEYALPPNVEVYSLGKERGGSRLRYALRFYRLLWTLRHRYDAVFVHMNQEYVLLGGVPWKMLGKKVLLWRNHPQGSFLTRAAVFLSDAVFATSSYAYVTRFRKTARMPAGIDTDRFRPLEGVVKRDRTVLMLGRISPVKKVEDFVRALALLREQDAVFSADIIGDAPPRDRGYYEKIAGLISAEELAARVTLQPGVKHEETPEIYNAHAVAVNLTPTGSFDKTILEAMACGTPVVASNRMLKGAIPALFVSEEGDIADTARHLKEVLDLPAAQRRLQGAALREYVVGSHSLALLMDMLAAAIQS